MVRCAIGRERSIQWSVFVVQSVVVLKSLQIMTRENSMHPVLSRLVSSSCAVVSRPDVQASAASGTP